MENIPLLGPAAPEEGWVPVPRYLLRRQRILRHVPARRRSAADEWAGHYRRYRRQDLIGVVSAPTQGIDAAALASTVRQHFDAGKWRHGISCHRETLHKIAQKSAGTQFLHLMRRGPLRHRAQRHD